MAAQFFVAHGTPGGAVPGPSESAGDVCQLDWLSDRRNATCNLNGLHAVAGSAWPPVLKDLLDIASAIYLADVASPRGALEEWVREIHIDIPVREVDFWEAAAPDLTHLLYTLTRDDISVRFKPRESSNGEAALPPNPPLDVDCVCLLSGGLDSFAGAAMLLQAGRKPLLVSHQSGNPLVESAQRRVVASLERLAPERSAWLGAHVAPARGANSWPYPAPELREPSRRARSFLFMALGVAAACATGVSEVYLCENGILTTGLPLTPARSGSLSTRSTHPMAVMLFGDIIEAADLSCTVVNPFIYQTKAEVLRTVLKPVIPPADIAQSVSCWSAGRQQRQCGGCVPCILRRISLLAAGLPDEAYMVDVLATPENSRGADAYGNLIDFITQAATILGHTEYQLLIDYPQLLDLDAAGLNVPDVVKTLRRHAAEVQRVLQDHFPGSANLLSQAV